MSAVCPIRRARGQTAPLASLAPQRPHSVRRRLTLAAACTLGRRSCGLALAARLLLRRRFSVKCFFFNRRRKASRLGFPDNSRPPWPSAADATSPPPASRLPAGTPRAINASRPLRLMRPLRFAYPRDDDSSVAAAVRLTPPSALRRRRSGFARGFAKIGVAAAPLRPGLRFRRSPAEIVLCVSRVARAAEAAALDTQKKKLIRRTPK